MKNEDKKEPDYKAPPLRGTVIRVLNSPVIDPVALLRDIRYFTCEELEV